MPAAASYYYTGGSSLSGVQPVSAFTLAAPNLHDVNVADTTTSHTIVQTGSSFYFQALVDLGPSPPPIIAFSSITTGATTGNASLQGSNNGTTWTQVATGQIGGPNGLAIEGAFLPAAYRYWQMYVSSSGSANTAFGMSDFRLYTNTASGANTALNYLYNGGTSAASPSPVSAFSLPAPNFYDGQVTDTGTYHYVTQAGSGGGNYVFNGLVDLGPNPPAVVAFSAVPYNASGGSRGLCGSNDGTTWTNITNLPYSGTGFFAAFAPANYRYYQTTMSFGGSYPQNVGLFDYRLYDSNQNLIAGPGSSGGPTNYPAETAAETTVLATGSRNAFSLASRVAWVAAFVVVASSGMLSHPAAATTYSARAAVSYVFSEQSASRAAFASSARGPVLPAFTENAATHFQSFSAETVTNQVFAGSETRSAGNYGGRAAAAGLVFSSAARSGRAAASGSTAPPDCAYYGSIFSSSAFSGSKANAPRSVTLSFCTETPQKGNRAFITRLAANTAVQEGFASSGLLTAAPLPGAVDSRDPFVVLAAELRFLLTALQGNPMTQTATTLAILDKLAASYRINELSQLANTLTALPALIRGGDGVTSTVYGYGADAPILKLLPAADQIIAQSSPNIVLAGIYRPIMAALQSYVSGLEFPSLDAYLTSMNTPTPYQALIHPNAALINWLFNNQQGTLLMSPGNVFAPSATFGTASVGASAGSLVFTHLLDIPALNVVSATAGQSTQGYTASKGCVANITGGINGTLTATLKATGQNAAGQAVTGRTWTAVLDNAAAGAAVAFSPAIAGDRIYGVTSISGAGTATAGGFTLTSVIERVVS